MAIVLAACGQSASSSGSPSTSSDHPPYIAAANYFGEGSAYNMWSSNLGNAKTALTQMKHDGFNAVALVVPWGGFQTGVTPPRYNQEAFSRLNNVIADAKQLGMGVLLRLSYFWDVNPADQMALSRFNAVWGNQQVYTSWLDYIAKVHQDVASFGNVWEAYLSWEDLWQPVQESLATTTSAQQLSLARSSGYQSWLQSKSGLSLSKVSTDYGTQFTSFSQVPTPSADRPSFRLMFRYEDWALVHHLFLPAAQRFPRLTLEARVDVDSVKTGTQVVGSYSHTAQFKLPGTSITGIYDTPYMNDPSSTTTETAAQGAAAMKTTLSHLASKIGNRHLFLYEYQFGRNSVEIAGNPEVVPSQIPAYLAQTVPILKKYTVGFALWTYHDYHLSSIFNPSFTLGSQGWTLQSGAAATAHAGQLKLQAGASASQKVAVAPSSGTTTTVSFEATASAATSVQVVVGSGPAQTIDVAPGTKEYKVTLPAPADASTLTLHASGSVSLTNVELYTTTLLGNVYSVTGSPEVGAAPLRAANKKLTGGS